MSYPKPHPWLPPLLVFSWLLMTSILPTYGQMTQDIDDIIGWASEEATNQPFEIMPPLSTSRTFISPNLQKGSIRVREPDLSFYSAASTLATNQDLETKGEVSEIRCLSFSNSEGRKALLSA